MSFGCNCFTRRTLRSHFQRVYAPHILSNLSNKDNNRVLTNKQISALNYSINTNNISNNDNVLDNTCCGSSSIVTYFTKSNNNQLALLNSDNLLQQEKQIKYKANNNISCLDKKISKIVVTKFFNDYSTNNTNYANYMLNLLIR